MNNKNKNNFLLLILILLFLFIFIIYFLFIYGKKENFEDEFENKLSLLAIFKNETMNLKVWLNHYINQGVEKFYLIDNDSDDKPLEILKPYIESGIVKYYYLPEKQKQLDHQKSIIIKENLGEKTKWLIICDLDEFYYGYPKKLNETLDEFSDYDIIISNFLMFGSDGHISHPENILKSIVWRDENHDWYTKYIYKPSKINVNNLGIHGHDTNHENKIIENDKIRLNHYSIQSEEFFKKVKMNRGDAVFTEKDKKRDMNYFNKCNENKTFKDEILANMT
jgi:cbb3-type cytochrome oxidase subunit 3